MLATVASCKRNRPCCALPGAAGSINIAQASIIPISRCTGSSHSNATKPKEDRRRHDAVFKKTGLRAVSLAGSDKVQKISGLRKSPTISFSARVGSWPEGEVSTCARNVGSQGNCGRDLLALSFTDCDDPTRIWGRGSLAGERDPT